MEKVRLFHDHHNFHRFDLSFFCVVPALFSPGMVIWWPMIMVFAVDLLLLVANEEIKAPGIESQGSFQNC